MSNGHLFKTIAIAALTAAPLFFATTNAHASYEAGKINFEGLKICKELGNTGWVGTARGHTSYADQYDAGLFNVRTCFKTKAECLNFVNRIEHHIYPVDVVTYRGCKPNS